MLGLRKTAVLAIGFILEIQHLAPVEAATAKSVQQATVGYSKKSTTGDVQLTPSAVDVGCKVGNDDRRSDLCAQWKAADAASASAKWAFWTLVVGFIGLVVGGGTLFAAWRAAHWAKEAARFTEASANEGKRAADAAERSIAESQRIGEAQVRRYVVAERARIARMADGTSAAVCVIKNFGMSPAKNIRVDGSLRLFDHETGEGVYFEKVNEYAKEHVHFAPPGQEVDLSTISFRMDDKDKSYILKKKKMLVTLRVSIKSEDVFGNEDSIDARFDALPENSFEESPFLEMKRGSDLA